jgi:DNA-binding winged helix-turn-helix (wHTH) protein
MSLRKVDDFLIKSRRALEAGAPTAEASGLPHPQAYAFGPFRILPSERVLRRGERTLPLPPKAFETLLLLVHNAGHVMRKDDLMKHLWPDTFVEDVNLASKISLLRKVLGDAGPRWTYIQTVAKLGYRFVPAVTRVWHSPAAPPGSARAEKASPERALRFIALPFHVVSGDEGIGFLAFSLPEASPHPWLDCAR